MSLWDEAMMQDDDSQPTLAQRRAQARILHRIEVPLVLVVLAVTAVSGYWAVGLVLLVLWLAVIPYVRVTQGFWCTSWSETFGVVAAALALYAGRGWLAQLVEASGLFAATGLRAALNGALMGVALVAVVVGRVLWQRWRYLRAERAALDAEQRHRVVDQG